MSKHNFFCEEAFGENYPETSLGRKKCTRFVWNLETNTRTAITFCEEYDPAVFEEPYYYYTQSVKCFCKNQGAPLVSINEELPPLYYKTWIEKYKKK